MAHQVFISYSAQDHAVAAATCSALERERVLCWIAPRNLQPGLSEEEATASAMKAARLMVVVLSAKSGHSPMLLHDVTRAVSQGIPMVLVRVGTLTLSRPLQALVPNPHWLEAANPPSAEQLDQVVKAVRALLPEEAPAERKQEDEEYINERIEAARLYFQYGLADRAIDKLNGVLQLFPFHAGSREELVRIYTESGKPREAADQLSQLAAIYESLGERDRARELKEKARALAPAEPGPEAIGDSTVKADPAKTRVFEEGASLQIPGGLIEQLHFSVTAPAVVAPGESFVVDLWGHREADRPRLLERAREASPGRPSPGSEAGVMLARLAIEGLTVEPREGPFLWEAQVGNARFRVRVPESSTADPRAGLATIHFGGQTIARLHFDLPVRPSGAPSSVAFIPVREDRPRH